MYKLFALVIGVICHTLFAFAVWSMGKGIFFGLESGSPGGWKAAAFDLLLLAQFPLLHSWLLTMPGQAFLRRLSPSKIASAMTTTWFATIASLQLIATFCFWRTIGPELIHAKDGWLYLSIILYSLSWLFLSKTMFDADLTLQSGLKGWWSVVLGKSPRYEPFPRTGTFAVCRQPIYFAFALILWTAPVWTIDRLLLAVIWTIYCYFGPRLKEARYLRRYGSAFVEYQKAVPYFVPAPR